MARIRTIKPEFWQNEQLAALSEHARLLAIALLNHADDKGFFLANPALVRAACFPFEEHSKKVLGSLQELSSVGYIEVRECDGKAIGVVCKFLDHQRIDKPQKSKLIDIFNANPRENEHSENIPGTFQECSKNSPRLERKGKEQGKEMEEEEEWEIPPSLDTPEVRESLGDFAAMRRKISKPIKSIANTSRILKNFDSPEHLLYAIDFCISNEYQGLKPDYRPSTGGRGGSGGRSPVTFAQQREANMQAAGDRFIMGATE